MNVNVEHDFHMVGGEGEISYAKNSRVQVTTHLSPSLTPPLPLAWCVNSLHVSNKQ